VVNPHGVPPVGVTAWVRFAGDTTRCVGGVVTALLSDAEGNPTHLRIRHHPKGKGKSRTEIRVVQLDAVALISWDDPDDPDDPDHSKPEPPPGPGLMSPALLAELTRMKRAGSGRG